MRQETGNQKKYRPFSVNFTKDRRVGNNWKTALPDRPKAAQTKSVMIPDLSGAGAPEWGNEKVFCIYRLGNLNNILEIDGPWPC